jgi:plasmid maintenance system antidote protein VapI
MLTLPAGRRHKPLTAAMIVRLREELGISADVLMGPQRRAA